MHFEILVEDQSGKHALDILVPKIIGDGHTFIVHQYKGIGHIPKNLKHGVDPRKRLLLNTLPRLLRGYGKTFATYPGGYNAAVIIVCDLDDRCLKVFREELNDILNGCDPKPETRFCIAIEESEAWYLGDIKAVKSAYPEAKDSVLNKYVNDSICGTWELLADAIYNGGSEALLSGGWQAVGREKSQWAVRISPYMDILNNKSPSFIYFKKRLLDFDSIDFEK
ncbi:MAG: DUF4276 family protein [Synergistaceae bacterium]|nr:DUF4276 family protein [Synergistaceae bacterium]